MPRPGMEVQALSPRGSDWNADARFSFGNATVVPSLRRYWKTLV
jgi:hypothetical protein